MIRQITTQGTHIELSDVGLLTLTLTYAKSYTYMFLPKIQSD